MAVELREVVQVQLEETPQNWAISDARRYDLYSRHARSIAAPGWALLATRSSRTLFASTGRSCDAVGELANGPLGDWVQYEDRLVGARLGEVAEMRTQVFGRHGWGFMAPLAATPEGNEHARADLAAGGHSAGDAGSAVPRVGERRAGAMLGRISRVRRGPQGWLATHYPRERSRRADPCGIAR